MHAVLVAAAIVMVLGFVGCRSSETREDTAEEEWSIGGWPNRWPVGVPERPENVADGTPFGRLKNEELPSLSGRVAGWYKMAYPDYDFYANASREDGRLRVEINCSQAVPWSDRIRVRQIVTTYVLVVRAQAVEEALKAAGLHEGVTGSRQELESLLTAANERLWQSGLDLNMGRTLQREVIGNPGPDIVKVMLFVYLDPDP